MPDLAAIFASALSPDSPAGGPQPYKNLRPRPPHPDALGIPPGAWLPPGFRLPLAAPSLPDPRFRGVPNFWRLNPGPRNNWRDMET